MSGGGGRPRACGQRSSASLGLRTAVVASPVKNNTPGGSGQPRVVMGLGLNMCGEGGVSLARNAYRLVREALLIGRNCALITKRFAYRLRLFVATVATEPFFR